MVYRGSWLRGGACVLLSICISFCESVQSVLNAWPKMSPGKKIHRMSKEISPSVYFEHVICATCICSLFSGGVQADRKPFSCRMSFILQSWLHLRPSNHNLFEWHFRILILLNESKWSAWTRIAPKWARKSIYEALHCRLQLRELVFLCLPCLGQLAV